MFIKQLKMLFVSASILFSSHHAVHAMDHNTPLENLVVAGTLEKILESAIDLLTEEEKEKIRAMIEALSYSSIPLVRTDEEYQRINDNYLKILESDEFAQEYLTCFCPYLDDDDNMRIEVKKSWHEIFETLRDYKLFLDRKIYPCFGLIMFEIMCTTQLKQAWQKGENGYEVIAKMIRMPILYYRLFNPRDGLDTVVGALSVGDLLLTKERMMLFFDSETYKSVANLYGDLFSAVAKDLYEYCFGGT